MAASFPRGWSVGSESIAKRQHCRLDTRRDLHPSIFNSAPPERANEHAGQGTGETEEHSRCQVRTEEGSDADLSSAQCHAGGEGARARRLGLPALATECR